MRITLEPSPGTHLVAACQLAVAIADKLQETIILIHDDIHIEVSPYASEGTIVDSYYRTRDRLERS